MISKEELAALPETVVREKILGALVLSTVKPAFWTSPEAMQMWRDVKELVTPEVYELSCAPGSTNLEWTDRHLKVKIALGRGIQRVDALDQIDKAREAGNVAALNTYQFGDKQSLTDDMDQFRRVLKLSGVYQVDKLDEESLASLWRVCKERPALREILNDVRISKSERRRRFEKEIALYRAVINKQKVVLDAEAYILDEQHAALEIGLTWLKECSANGVRIERPESSALHKLEEASARKKIYLPLPGKDSVLRDLMDAFTVQIEAKPKVFLVEHDLAAAFRGAADFGEGEFQLPYDECAFEFKLSGRRVIAICSTGLEKREGQIYSFMAFALFNDYWIALPNVYTVMSDGVVRAYYETDTGESKEHVTVFAKIICEQIRAVCISLDAEVMEAEVVRAPPKLNASRVKSGKPPISDFHIVRLSASRRRRTETPGDSGLETRERRLHFRRGHWRHYPSWRTWIKWQLVGNPDLGFIDKEYRI